MPTGPHDEAAGDRTGPLVTVAIPTFRRPDWLRCAIDCALAQTYRNTEILVSDSDASDEIVELVASYGDPRLRYRRNDHPTTGLENALAMYRDARGEFVATLHDDDEWDREFLEVMLAPLLADPSLVLSFADHWVMDPGGIVLPEETRSYTCERGRSGLPEGRYQPFTSLALVDRAVFFVAATVFRNGIIDWDEVPPEAAPPYEIWMTYLASRDGAAAYYVPQRLMRYRLHGDSDGHTMRLETGAVWTYDRIMADERMADLLPGLRRASAPFRASLGLSLLAAGDAAPARAHLRQAFADGARTRAGAGLLISMMPRPARAPSIQRLRAQRARRRVRLHSVTGDRT